MSASRKSLKKPEKPPIFVDDLIAEEKISDAEAALSGSDISFSDRWLSLADKFAQILKIGRKKK